MQMDNVKKILVVKLDHIGDLILATPVFRAIKEAYPNIELDIVVAPKSAAVIQCSPFISKIFFYSSFDFDRDGSINEVTRLNNMRTICAIRGENYDLCIGLREDLNNIMIQSLFGAKKNISFRTNTIFSELLDESVVNDAQKHNVEIYFDLLRLIGVPKPDIIQPEIFVTPESDGWAKKFLADEKVEDNDILLGISPGGGWFLNWWPYEKFAELINKLYLFDSRIKIVLLGGTAELRVAQQIKDLVGKPVIDTVGKTTIEELAALCKYLKFVITNDGGPMHIATAAGTSVVALFGPSPYKRFGPVGRDNIVISQNMPCSPCPQFVQGEKPKCLENKCMKEISVDEVYDVCIKKLMLL